MNQISYRYSIQILPNILILIIKVSYFAWIRMFVFCIDYLPTMTFNVKLVSWAFILVSWISPERNLLPIVQKTLYHISLKNETVIVQIYRIPVNCISKNFVHLLVVDFWHTIYFSVDKRRLTVDRENIAITFYIRTK